jgi:3-deoxy-7-phosphoheptulonate synthase
MVAVLKPGTTQQQIDNLTKWFKSRGLDVHLSVGQYRTIIGLIGDTSKIDIELLEGLEMIESVTRITEPFKSANRKFHPDDTVVDVAGVKIGGGHFQLIAGPCSVESPEQILGIAESVKASGAAILRGGAFKPRTSPYDFQGLRAEGIELLLEAKKKTGMPIITEIMNANHLELFGEVDIIQVGARNMQNFELLKELGKTDKPILLKRGLANTLKELLMSAEYIMAGGMNCTRRFIPFVSGARRPSAYLPPMRSMCSQSRRKRPILTAFTRNFPATGTISTPPARRP